MILKCMKTYLTSLITEFKLKLKSGTIVLPIRLAEFQKFSITFFGKVWGTRYFCLLLMEVCKLKQLLQGQFENFHQIHKCKYTL